MTGDLFESPFWPQGPGDPNELLRLVLDNIPQAVFWKDRESRYLGCNLNFAIAAGVGTPDRIRGKTDLDLPWSKTEARWYRDVDQRVMERDQAENHIQETQLQADGHLAWVDTNKIPLHAPDGRVVGILGTFEDITDRIRNQKALQQAHDELEARVAERTAAEREQRTLAEALRDSAAVINSTLDLDQVLVRILSEIGRVVPHTAAAIVMMLGPERSYVRRWSPGLVLPPAEDAHWKTMIETHRPLIINQADRSFLSVPILSEGEVIGFIELYSSVVGFFRPQDGERLAAFANQAALAIQNARLFERAQETAALEERQRLARDLHDAISQTLWTVSLLADLLPSRWEADRSEGLSILDRLRQLTQGALIEMRTLLMELRPGALAGAKLADLLRQLATAAMTRKKIRIQVAVRGDGIPPAEVQTAVYRIAQEAVTNVIRHSQAGRAWLTLTQGPGSLRLAVRDDGQGFTSDPGPGHYGLAIMRERAQSIGARVLVEAQAGRGTRVSLCWPAVDTPRRRPLR